jgi:hypothetical protein
MYQLVLTAPNPLIYFQTAPRGILSSIVRLLCLPETPVGSWGRYKGNWKIGVADQERTPPAARSGLGQSLNLGESQGAGLPWQYHNYADLKEENLETK